MDIAQHIGKASDLAQTGDRRLYRFFEILPGAVSWLTIVAVVVCSLLFPEGSAIFIIVFDVYWLVKTIYLSLHLRYGYRQTRKNLKTPWRTLLEKLQGWRDIHHIIILPMYREPLELVRASLASLAHANYPQDRMIVVLAQEERAGAEFNTGIAHALTQEFGATFLRFAVTLHPGTIAGELAGKGANIAWAGRQIKQEIVDPLKLAYEHLMVSVFDIDTVIYPEYFGRLTHAFLTTASPLRASYQPIPYFINNIWDAPAFARMVAFSSTFWQTIQQARAENLITFSSHSMPWQAVVDIDFWQANMVSEDSRVFWQCLLRYDGDYRVVPLYYPVSMDANVAPTMRETMVNVYKQHRRWGYGVENVPYYLFGFIKNKRIALGKKLFYTIAISEGYWSWATNAIMLFLLGWLPGLLGGPHFNATVLSFNHSVLSSAILRLALLALITPMVLSFLIMPPRPADKGKSKYIWMLLQWVLFPITTIVFGAFPGLEAQTRLMLGKYMGFWITPKHRNVTRSEPSIASE